MRNGRDCAARGAKAPAAYAATRGAKSDPASQQGLELVCFREFWREKLVDRKLDLFKDLAGIVRGDIAFLVRDRVVVNRNHHLNIAFKLHDCEQSDGHQNDLLGLAGCEIAVKLAADAAGKGNSTVQGPAGAIFHQFAVKHHGFHNGNACFGHIGVVAIQRIAGVCGGINLYVSVAAVKNDLFGKRRHTGYGRGRDDRRCIGGYRHFEEKGDVDRIESFVKGNWLHIQINGDNFQVLDLCADGVVDDRLCTIGKEYLQVAQAVFISTLCRLSQRISGY